MPYDEPDAEDPMELMAVSLPGCGEETLFEKARCFAEEYLLLGHGPEDILKLFRDPFYAGAHELLVKLGEERIGAIMAEVTRSLRPRRGQGGGESHG